MYLKRLYLHHFRNYTDVQVTFAPGINWITGKNAQGKTNLLEAIYFLSTGRSFRTQHLKELIQEGESYFYLEAEIEKEGVIQTLKASFDGENKRAQYNATQYSHFTSLMGLLPHVLSAPDDSTLITGPPAIRRKFLNMHIAQADPLYIHHLGRYGRSLAQRNQLIRQKSEVAIEPWEETMAESALYLMEKREELIQELQTVVSPFMNSLSSHADTLHLQYQPSLTYPNDKIGLKNHWKAYRKREMHIGTTLLGPHRDDLTLLVNNQNARSFASEGQKYCITSSLRLALWQHLQQATGDLPLMSVDDYGVHLDLERRNLLEQQFSKLGQVFLTSPILHQETGAKTAGFTVQAGKIFI